ncbi:LysR family transcriptional regulator [Paraburkholderia ginsengiterrae]|uniref:LysR family transcriptional regulator n=1 Tax=Paraburkholderia ginsengiterrae TaxID=1462993 RepID=A0A1A9N4B9_9BURK|nr:LysR family transcriptional regulator [Paraburkholderia ginsengiterrae]OAJ57288.1 LysR family transcriptional regulator [Paraburkholderia ginsengiterrae]OAJ60932.1 LysR family transcriptional regulator [Paraburkholderia ginsengiterrae]
MDRLTQMEFFVLTADLGSLSQAAERLGISNAAASRMLSALEDRLGARLVERTTRRLWLTDAGREYRRRCGSILSELAEADTAVSDMAQQPRGVLRVTSSVSFAGLHIAPWLPEFNQRYPELVVQITAANRYPNFIEAGIDVAIRTREHEGDSGITVRRLAHTRRVLAASPGYLAQHGEPRTPEELAQHNMLVYSYAVNPYQLQLKRGRERRNIPINAMLESNEGQVICAAGRAGLGIVIQPLYIVHDDIVAGRLIPLLGDWELAPLTINIAYQSRRNQPAKIRVFADALTEYVRKLDLEARWTTLPSSPSRAQKKN